MFYILRPKNGWGDSASPSGLKTEMRQKSLWRPFDPWCQETRVDSDFHPGLTLTECWKWPGVCGVSMWCEPVSASLSADERPSPTDTEPWACSPTNLVRAGGRRLRVATQNFKRVKKALWTLHCHTHTPRETACCCAPTYHASGHLISSPGSVNA